MGCFLRLIFSAPAEWSCSLKTSSVFNPLPISHFKRMFGASIVSPLGEKCRSVSRKLTTRLIGLSFGLRVT
jgi:hypothetical protein